MRALFICVALSFSLRAQTMVAPLAGTMLDSQGRIQMLHGVMGNLLPPRYVAPPVQLQGQALLAGAFEANGGMLKTPSHLAVLDSQGSLLSTSPAPEGTALFGFTADGTPAWVWYAADSELVNIASGASSNAPGVVALGPGGSLSVALLTAVGDQLWNGAVPIAGAGPAAFFQGGWITTSRSSVLWTPLTGGAPAREIALPEPVQTMQTAGPAALVINGQWLLNARFQFIEIPGAPRRQPKAHR